MPKSNLQSPLFVGIKLGLQAIIVMACFSPLLVAINLYATALERDVSFSLNSTPMDLYCFGGPIMVLLWFSLPYLFGGIGLALLMRRQSSNFATRLGGAIGMLTGIIGDWLMAKNFLISSLDGLHISDWVLIGLMGIWSIAIFMWVANRNYKFKEIPESADIPPSATSRH